MIEQWASCLSMCLLASSDSHAGCRSRNILLSTNLSCAKIADAGTVSLAKNCPCIAMQGLAEQRLYKHCLVFSMLCACCRQDASATVASPSLHAHLTLYWHLNVCDPSKGCQRCHCPPSC